jgi:hypothetical protein
MIANLRPTSDAEIDRLLANPAEITRFLYGGGAADGVERVGLNKTWHAIHFVLTGSRLGGEAPLNFLVDEGTPVGEVDVGFGPARVLRSDQVRRIAAALVAIDPDEVARRVDVQRFDQEAIYPGHWQRNGSGVDDVVTSYRAMRDLIGRAADRGQGLVLYVH